MSRIGGAPTMRRCLLAAGIRSGISVASTRNHNALLVISRYATTKTTTNSTTKRHSAAKASVTTAAETAAAESKKISTKTAAITATTRPKTTRKKAALDAETPVPFDAAVEPSVTPVKKTTRPSSTGATAAKTTTAAKKTTTRKTAAQKAADAAEAGDAPSSEVPAKPKRMTTAQKLKAAAAATAVESLPTTTEATQTCETEAEDKIKRSAASTQVTSASIDSAAPASKATSKTKTESASAASNRTPPAPKTSFTSSASIPPITNPIPPAANVADSATETVASKEVETRAPTTTSGVSSAPKTPDYPKKAQTLAMKSAGPAKLAISGATRSSNAPKEVFAVGVSSAVKELQPNTTVVQTAVPVATAKTTPAGSRGVAPTKTGTAAAAATTRTPVTSRFAPAAVVNVAAKLPLQPAAAPKVPSAEEQEKGPLPPAWQGRGQMPKRYDTNSKEYKDRARQWLKGMVGLPVLIVLSYHLYDRLVLGNGPDERIKFTGQGVLLGPKVPTAEPDTIETSTETA